jgi:hypothetical protein
MCSSRCCNKGGGRCQTKKPLEHDLVSPFVISVSTTPNVN